MCVCRRWPFIKIENIDVSFFKMSKSKYGWPFWIYGFRVKGRDPAERTRAAAQIVVVRCTQHDNKT